MGDIHAILGGTKRTGDKGSARQSQSRGKEESQQRRDRRRAVWENDLKGGRDDGHRRGRTSERGHKKRDASPARQEKRRSRRDQSGSGEDDRPRQGRSRRGGSKSPRRDRRSRSPSREKKNYRQRSRRRSPSIHVPSELTADPNTGDDSDPFNDFIGPAPPPRHRGRGTIGGAANLDRRFSASYNPRTDTQDYDTGQGDWEDAVESYRNSQKLGLNQSQPARPTGFAENQARGAEGGREKSDKDVVWTKAGERRAWDQGKDSD